MCRNLSFCVVPHPPTPSPAWKRGALPSPILGERRPERSEGQGEGRVCEKSTYFGKFYIT